MKKSILTLGFVIIVALVGIFFLRGAPDKQAEENSQVAEISPSEAGSYEPYAPEKLARAEDGDVVIFFYAAWCPTCRALDANIKNNLSDIPPGVSILKADYDQEVELKKKYGITVQHTLVQVDSNGDLIKKWSGGTKLQFILSQIE